MMIKSKTVDESVEDQESVKKIGEHRKFLGLRLSALIELVVFFLIIVVCALLLGRKDLFFSVSPHPFWVIVILLSVQYGTAEGLIAASVSTIVLLLGQFPQRDIVQDQFQYFLYIAKNPLLWFVAAVILGEVRNRHIRERDKLKTVAIEAEEKEKTISNSYNQLKAVKERLDVKVASEMQTALMAYESFKKMEVLDRDTLLKGGMELIKNFLIPEKSSIFILEGDKLNRFAEEGWETKDVYQTNIASDNPIFPEVVGKSRVLSVLNPGDRVVLSEEGVMAAPIKSVQPLAVYGMVKIEKLPFTQFRLNTLETLRMIGEWIGTAYASYVAKKEAEEARYIDSKTQLLTQNYLHYQKTFLTNLGRRLKTSVILLHIALESLEDMDGDKKMEAMKRFKKAVTENLRTTDQVFEYAQKELEFALLVINTPKEGCDRIKEKMNLAMEKEFDKRVKTSFRIEPLYLYENEKGSQDSLSGR